MSFRFYYRSGGCNNGDCTYHDYLVLENYVNNSYRLNELVDLARSYLDTAKGDIPIQGVTFVGEAPDTHLPPGMYKTYSEHADYQIATVAFSKSSDEKNYTGSSKKNIGVIMTWEKGESTFYESPSVDSLLKANPLLDNRN